MCKRFLAGALLLGVIMTTSMASAQTTVSFFMDDGIELATDIYATTFQPQPVLLIRTPDGRASLEELAWTLVNRYDVKVVVQDVRGHGDSGGEEALFTTAANDGLDTLGWIDTLGWSNGVIGGYGLGINGLEQLLIAGAGDPSFKCLYLENSSGNLPHAGIYEGGIRRTEFDIWAKGLGAGWAPQEWSLHPEQDDTYWDFMKLGDDEAALITVPGLHLTGWYDVNQKGAIESFRRLQDHGGVGAAGRQRLVIGPWSHKGTTGDLVFPDAIGSETVLEWEKAWATDCLHGETGTLDALPEVLLYLMGADEPEAPGNAWETFETWPPPSVPVPLYLRNKKRLTTAPPGPGELGQLFEHEPLDPVGTIGGRNLRIAQGPKDQTEIEEREDVAVYTSEPLKDPVTVVGDISAQLWVLTDWDITDVIVRLTDVYPDGRSMLVASGVQRIFKMANEQLVDLDLWATGMVFNVGHQIRISISGAMKGAYTPAEERFSALVTNSVEFPSRLTLPVLSGLAPEEIGQDAEGAEGDVADGPMDDVITPQDIVLPVDLGPVEDLVTAEVVTVPDTVTPIDTGETGEGNDGGGGGGCGGCGSSQGLPGEGLLVLGIGLWLVSRRRLG
ncbi:MAG: CocE/NonD family hydrolase [Myxococcota bacterium]|nr:CocE/NonD family hydrolase [Myxococcota bacterium]